MCIPPCEPLAHPIIVKCKSLGASVLWCHSLMPPIGRDCSLCSLLSTAALHPSLPPSLLPPSHPPPPPPSRRITLLPSSPHPAHSYIPHPTPPFPRSHSPPLPLAPAQYLIRDAAHTADCCVPLFMVSRRRPVVACGINTHRLLVAVGRRRLGGGLEAEWKSKVCSLRGAARRRPLGRRVGGHMLVALRATSHQLPIESNQCRQECTQTHKHTRTHARSQVDDCD